MTGTSPGGWHVAQRRYWTSVAASYDALYESEWAARENAVVASRLRFLQNLDRPLVIDLAAGTGLGLSLVRDVNPRARYVGVDISGEMISAARTPFSALIATMTEAPLRSGVADAVLCLFTSTSFASNLDGLLQEVERVLRPGGRAYLSALSRLALSRTRRSSWAGHYRTRGDGGHGSVPAHRLLRSVVTRAAQRAGLVLDRIEPLNAFSGVLERPSLWRLGSALASLAPASSHSIELTLHKAEPT